MAETPLAREFTKGLWRENPLFVMTLGLCPSLAVTTSAVNGIVMGFCVIFVLTGSNVVISLIRGIVPKEIRIPIFIVVIASFVTLTEIALKYLSYPLYEKFGIFISLIVVNCIILARAEAFAQKNGVLRSALDGIGIGAGFGIALVIVSSIREVVGSGAIFGMKLANWTGAGVDAVFQPISVFILAPGAFLVLGLLLGLFQYRKLVKGRA
ncbi:MAG: electron transport complex subunit RsxE [Planctomycetes bacterium]|jgi:electron transport complex protein RnfE|nr:electron transport complex subunit RsxE [Planctomycetota bacterium]